MTNAQGIHEHPDLKLGLRKPDKSLPRLKASNFLTGITPNHAQTVDHLTGNGLTFGLYTNDRFGVCGPTSVANLKRLVSFWLTGTMKKMPLDDVYELYRASGNPNFDPATGADDNGVNMQEMLTAAAKMGIILGFAEVDVTNDEEMEACTDIFGGTLEGVVLQVAQQGQTQLGTWDYQTSSQWGGHAILKGAHEEAGNYQDVITWAKRVKSTESFRRHQLQECWLVILPEHLQSQGFRQGWNMTDYSKAYRDITGREFPGAVKPAPVEPPPFWKTVWLAILAFLKRLINL